MPKVSGSKLMAQIRRHGLRSALFAVCLRLLNRLFFLKILRGICVERPEESYLSTPRDYRAGFLAGEELRAYATDARSEISQSFLDEATRRADECYAIRDGAVLAAYGWYGRGTTPIGLGKLGVSFSRDYVYMYKGFTDKRYRGERLHAVGMTRALAHYLACGYRGLVSYVEADNFDSLKSCFRMGYRVFGSIYVVRLFGCYFAVATPGCKAYEFRLSGPVRQVVMDVSQERSLRFDEMKSLQKAKHAFKVAICLLSFGLIFPNIMGD